MASATKGSCSLSLMLALALTAAACDGAASSGEVRASAAGAPSAFVPIRAGDMALDYVTDERFPALKIEVAHIEGAAPSLEALHRVAEVLERRLRKPAGIDVHIEAEIPREAAQAMRRDIDLQALELAYRRHWSGDANNRDRAVIWVVYVDGESEHDDASTCALGLAFGGSQVAIFPDSIDLVSAPEQRAHAEALVLLHEVGHLLGLVNNGTPATSDHEDPFHPFHDADPRCVMHHRIDAWDPLEPPAAAPLDFGYACRLDLHAIGGPPPGKPDDPALADRGGLPRSAVRAAAGLAERGLTSRARR